MPFKPPIVHLELKTLEARSHFQIHLWPHIYNPHSPTIN
jgi:hypothetical protein